MSENATMGSGVMTRLREETMELHRETEHGAFQQELLTGKLSLDAYAELLQQLLFVHRALENALREASARDPLVAAIVREEQFVEPHLLRDLQHYGRQAPEATPLPATDAMVGEIVETGRRRPAELLGVHYVFEGSKNGGRFIARAMRKAYGIDGDAGLAYMEPYGELQQERWQAFKASMEALVLTKDDQDAIVAAAKATFRALIGVHRELHAAVAVGEP